MEAPLRITEIQDRCVDVVWHAQPLLRYQYTDTLRPHAHPVNLPDGRCATLARPHDHVWHSGLYHCPKFVDDVSLWEGELHQARDADPSIPCDPDHHGRGRYGRLSLDALKTYTGLTDVGFTAFLTWRTSDRETLGREEQHWRICPPDPDGRAYLVLLRISCTAVGDTRRLWAGRYGYGGMSWRSPRAMNGGVILEDTGRQRPVALQNGPARWLDYTGPLDGIGRHPLTGAVLGMRTYQDPARLAGVTLMQHPDNPQSSFFSLGEFGFLSCHPGYPDPYRLLPNAAVHFSYAALVHAWPGSVSRIAPYYERFLALAGSSMETTHGTHTTWHTTG